MTYHPDSAELQTYIGPLILDIIRPLGIMFYMAPEPSNTPAEDAVLAIKMALHSLALQLATADGSISVLEVALMQDICSLLEEDAPSLSLTQQLTMAHKLVKEMPEIFGVLRKPLVVDLLETYDNRFGTFYTDKAKAMFFRFANAIVKADGNVTRQEEAILDEFREILYASMSYSHDGTFDKFANLNPIEVSAIPKQNEKTLDELLEELKLLIGLDNIKKDVSELVNFIRIQQMRQVKGMAGVPISRHLVFLGNPGTGKTTVARLLSQIYRALGIVSKGHLIETDRSGLVAGYLGQTALKVKDVVNQALGGVLFIDEAYALVGGDQDYGQEAIDTLIKLMEDNRDDLIVVVAGYTEKMNHFLLSNPGLKSRFNKFFLFDDYSPQQLLLIFELFCKNSGFVLTSDASKKVAAVFQLLYDMRDKTFGNARLARNVFEHALNNQANRIISISHITEDILSTLDASDIPGEIELRATDPIDTNHPKEKPREHKKSIAEFAEILTNNPQDVQAWLQLSEIVEPAKSIL